MVDLKMPLCDLKGIVLVPFFHQLFSTLMEKKLRKTYVHGERETGYSHVEKAKRDRGHPCRSRFT